MGTALDNRSDTWLGTFRQALIDLGRSWLINDAPPFSASFITTAAGVYDNLLTAWPKEAAPQDSLILLCHGSPDPDN